MIQLTLPHLNIWLVAQGVPKESTSLLHFLKAEISSEGYKRLSACAAYASYRGVLLTRSLLSGLNSAEYRWLIGLDDTLTDPLALSVAMQTIGAHTRVAQLLKKGSKRRFHPKAYLIDRNPAGGATLVVGSCNLTEAALKSNCEVFVAYRARNAEDADELRVFWESLWKTGHSLTNDILGEYRSKFLLKAEHEPAVQEEAPSQKPQKQPKYVAKAINESLANSKLAWIVLGKNTGGGSQLDIVKNLGPFLGLPLEPKDGDHCYLEINTSLGKKNYIMTFTKGMWRFMNLQQGFQEPLRPDLKQPSPYVLVLERQDDGQTIKMHIVLEAEEHAIDMIAHSIDLGFAYESKAGASGRLYGWF